MKRECSPHLTLFFSDFHHFNTGKGTKQLRLTETERQREKVTEEKGQCRE